MAQGQRGGGGGGPPKKKDAGFNTPFSGLKQVVAKQKLKLD